MTLLTNLATIFGSLMALSGLPQTVRIFRRRSAGDISVITYFILFVGSLVWIMYGIEINSFPIIITNAIGIVTVSSVILGCILYGRRK
jgi:MtN3 and saliva related transmembrane protein